MGQMSHPMPLHGHPFKTVAADGPAVPKGARLTMDVTNIGPEEHYDLLVELTNPGEWMFHCHIQSHTANRGVEPGGMITIVNIAR